MKCYYCGDSNIFCLGFIYMKSGNHVTICRNKCLDDQLKLKPLLKFMILIQDRMILYDFVANNTQKCSTITSISHMELVERSQELGFCNELAVKNPEVFENSEAYISTMYKFVELLRKHEEFVNRNQLQSNVTIEWTGRGKQCRGSYHKSESITADFMTGLNLKISNLRDEFVTDAKVEKVEGDLVRFSCDAVVDQLSCPLFDVQVVGNFITCDRLEFATMNFCKLSDEIKSILLDPREVLQSVEDYNIVLPSGDIKLNNKQKEAVVKAMTRPLSLIQGPPGTGKTFTSAMIIYNYLNSEMRDGPALVCASSNTATDNLAEKMLQYGMKVVRVISASVECIPVLREVTLDFLAKKACQEEQKAKAEAAAQAEEDAKESNDLNPDYEDLKPKARRERRTRRGFINEEEGERSLNPKSFYKQVLRSADVICCTCSSAGSNAMQELSHASFILIDEATQSIEPETLIPLQKMPLRVVLVGDQNQLGPTALIKDAEKLGYYKSLFQRLIDNGYEFTMLNTQFRMHPKISLYPSQAFYGGEVKDGVTEAARALTPEFLQIWPKLEIPVVFHHVKQYEELNPTGLSYLNRHEYIRILDIIMKLRELGVDMAEVGLITPYEGQVSMIKQKFKEFCADDPTYKFDEIQVSSIDGFQGKEKDFIIISCVRSNKRSSIGFLNNRNRLNVALTRARKGLALVGNASSLIREELWEDYIRFLKDHELFVSLNKDTDDYDDIMMMLRHKKKHGVTLLPMPDFTNVCFDNAMMYGNIYGDLNKVQPNLQLDHATIAKGDWALTNLGDELRRQQYMLKTKVEETKVIRSFRRAQATAAKSEEHKDKPVSSKFANLKTVRPGGTQPQELPSTNEAAGLPKPRVNFKSEHDRLISEELRFTLQSSRYS
mmetsp:Transcript_20367/g.38099  ORF Transcript_20367/g.38099 Transcript_20367/m.38099 type:complete len:891 (+) Transcript_20367:242-2914(+)